MSFHKDLAGANVHVPHAFTYTDEAARLAAVSADFTDPADLFKIARQTSDTTYWVLEQVTPTVVWFQFGGGGGAGSQTPWLQDIDADRFDLTRVAGIEQAGGDAAKLYTPTQVSVTATGTNPRFSVVQANYLYVCDANDNDLRIYDVTDPTAPVLVGSLVIGGGRGVDVAGRYVYYTDEDNGGRLVIVDVEDKSTPVVVGSVVTGGSPRGVKVQGTIAVATYNSTIDGARTFDVSDPTAPVQLDTTGLQGAGRTDLDIRGTIVAVPTSQGVRLLDISDPNSIVILSDFGGEVDSCKFQGRYLYTANETTDEFEVWDTVDPSLPVLVGQLALVAPASVRSISVSGDFAYFVDASNDEMRVVDISDPTAPAFISTAVSVGLNPIAITTVGRYAYVLDNNGDQFLIFDLGGIAAQNLNVGNIDAGNMNLRKDLKIGGVLSAVGGSFGTGGIFSDGEIASAGNLRGFDLLLAGFIELGQDVPATPAPGTPSIYHTVLGTNFDVPTGDGYLLQVNGALEYDFDVVRADFNFNRLVNLGRVELSTDVAPAATAQAIWADVGGLKFNVDGGASEDFAFQVSGGTVFTVRNTGLVMAGRDIEGVTALEFASGFDPGPTIANIHTTALRMVYNALAGTEHRFQIAGLPVLELRDTEADFEGNNLVNVGDVRSATGNLPALGFVKMDDLDLLAWRNAANDNDNALGFVSDELEIVFDSVIRYSLTDAHLNMTGRNLFDAGQLLLGASAAPAVTEHAVWADAGGIHLNVPTGDLFELLVNGASEYDFDALRADFKGNNLIDAGRLELAVASGPAASQVALWHDGADLNTNVPTGGSHILEINGIDSYIFSLSQLDMTSRDLVNVGDINGRPHASLGDNVVEIFVEADFPGNATEIQLAVGTTYILMAPISTARTIKHPATGGAFTPSTILGSQKETTTLTYTNSATAPMFSTQGGQGQLVLQNLIITNDSLSQPVFDLLGNAQTQLLTELDNTVISDNSGEQSTIELCIFNVNNESFLQDLLHIELIDVEANILDSFTANSSDTDLPQFIIRERDLSSVARTLFNLRNCKLSSHPNESYLLIHHVLPAGSLVSVDGLTASPFTPGTGSFYGDDFDSVQQLSDSVVNPGTHTRVHDAGHSVLDGDDVTFSGFTGQTQYNGVRYIAVNVVEGATFDVEEVFVANDFTGQWEYDSITGKVDPVRVINSPPESDSRSVGSLVAGTSTLTVINTVDIFENLNLDGTAVEASTIERFTLTNATLGQLTYVGENPFSGTLLANLTLTKGSGNADDFIIRAVVNDAPTPDNIQAIQAVGSDHGTITLVTPIELVTGDEVEIEIANDDTTADVAVVHMAMSIQ